LVLNRSGETFGRGGENVLFDDEPAGKSAGDEVRNETGNVEIALT
jgi:hypothetical protein